MDLDGRSAPGLAGPLMAFYEATNGGIDLSDICAARIVEREMYKAHAVAFDPAAGLTRILDTAVVKGQPRHVPVRIYKPTASSQELPAVLWIHGGGFVLGSAQQDEYKAVEFATDCNCVVVCVDYCLAPEYPFPAPLDDCYTALKWMFENGDKLGIDTTRVAIAGASAGGGLAAGLALLARDRQEIQIAFQVLIYPMLDDRNIAPIKGEKPRHYVWDHALNKIGWNSYLGDAANSECVSPYAAPFRASDLRGLPPAYLPVGELDLFLNENIAYAQRLLKAGVAVELHIYPGAFHGFTGLAPDADVSRRCVLETNNAISRALKSGHRWANDRSCRRFT